MGGVFTSLMDGAVDIYQDGSAWIIIFGASDAVPFLNPGPGTGIDEMRASGSSNTQ